jgi:predicted nucleotidyltransferase
VIDLERTARIIRLQNEEETRALELRRSRAQQLGRSLAQEINALHPGTGRIWGFGSVFETWRNYRMTSDIDLAVESGDTMELLPLVEGREFAVDVLDLSSCPSPLADFIREHGTLLAGDGK